MKWFRFSTYNIKNIPEDDYAKVYNEAYQKNKKDYFKFLIHWNWFVPHIPFEGIEFAHEWNRTHLVFCGADNLYWLQLRDSPRWDEKAKWKIRIFKTHNDHCSCG